MYAVVDLLMIMMKNLDPIRLGVVDPDPGPYPEPQPEPQPNHNHHHNQGQSQKSLYQNLLLKKTKYLIYL